MRCETDNGSVRQVRTTAELDAAISDAGSGGHIILGNDRRFVQVAFQGSDALVQYGEDGVLSESAMPLTRGEAREILAAFFDGDDSWKGRYQWSVLSSGAPAGGMSAREGDQELPGTPEDIAAPKSDRGIGGMLADEASRAIKRGAGRAIRQGLRRFIK